MKRTVPGVGRRNWTASHHGAASRLAGVHEENRLSFHYGEQGPAFQERPCSAMVASEFSRKAPAASRGGSSCAVEARPKMAMARLVIVTHQPIEIFAWMC